MPAIDHYRVLSFDCYGTLIDWDTGIGDQLEDWAARSGVDEDRERLLAEFGAVETNVQRSNPGLPYPDVLAETLRSIGRGLGIPVSDEDAAGFGRSVPNWPAFPDATEALERLAETHRLVIVSNIDDTSFEASNRRLRGVFDAVITASQVGSYKPADGHFLRLLDLIDEWGVPRGSLLHVAESLYHDHEPAARFGIDSAWIHRRAGRTGHGATAPPADPSVRPTFRFESMAEFADAMS